MYIGLPSNTGGCVYFWWAAWGDHKKKIPTVRSKESLVFEALDGGFGLREDIGGFTTESKNPKP